MVGEPNASRSGIGSDIESDRRDAPMSISSYSGNVMLRLRLRSVDGLVSGIAIGISTKSSQTQTLVLRVSSKGP